MLSITPQTETIILDQREIESFAVDAQSPAIVVRYADGYQDSAGKFAAVKHNAYRLPSEAVQTVMGMAADGSTLYEAIKAALYAALPVVQAVQDAPGDLGEVLEDLAAPAPEETPIEDEVMP